MERLYEWTKHSGVEMLVISVDVDSAAKAGVNGAAIEHTFDERGCGKPRSSPAFST